MPKYYLEKDGGIVSLFKVESGWLTDNKYGEFFVEKVASGKYAKMISLYRELTDE